MRATQTAVCGGLMLLLAACGSSGPALVTPSKLSGCIESSSNGTATIEGAAVTTIAQKAGRSNSFGVRLASDDVADVSVWPSAAKAKAVRDEYNRLYLSGTQSAPTSGSIRDHFAVTDQMRNVVVTYDHPPDSASRAMIRGCAK